MRRAGELSSPSRAGCLSAATASAAASSASAVPPAELSSTGPALRSASTVSDRPILTVAFSSARSACSAWIRAACSVTAAVTNGFPSRSAPIQLP